MAVSVLRNSPASRILGFGAFVSNTGAWFRHFWIIIWWMYSTSSMLLNKGFKSFIHALEEAAISFL